MSELEDLYQEIILDHNKRPRNFGSLPEANRVADGHNPLCGDELKVYLLVDGDVVKDVKFEGEGCAISRASASLMTESLKGKTRAEAEAEMKRVEALLTGEEEPVADLATHGELSALIGVRKFPARIKCATLGWRAAEAALRGEEGATTE